MNSGSAENHIFVGRAASLWQFAANHPVLSVFIITISQNGLTLWARDLWWADEVRHAGVLLQMLDNGDWLALNLNGDYYPDKPPLYFWLMSALMKILSSREQWVVFFGLALTVFCFFLAIYHLAFRLLGDRRMALLALIIAATGSYLVSLSHYARMDFLFTAFICASWACLYDGIKGNQANRSVVYGFVWSALAIMTKGPLGFAFPVLGLLGYLWWCNRLAVIIRWDFAFGILLAAIVTALWAAGLSYFAGFDYLMHLLRGQIVERGLRSDNGILEHGRYFVTLPLVFLPWTLVFIGGWKLSGSGGQVTRGVPRPVHAGVFFAVGCLIAGFGLLSAIGEKHEYYLLPLLVLLSIISADRFSRLSADQHSRFWRWTAVYFLVVGTSFVMAGLLPVTNALLEENYGVTLNGAVATGGFTMLFGVCLWGMRWRGQPFLLLLMLAGQTIWVNLLILLVIASLNPIWSTKSVVDKALPFVESGYSVGIQHGIRGVFAYHLGVSYAELGDAQGIRIWVEENPRSVVVMSRLSWRRMMPSFPELRVVACAAVAGLDMVLLTAETSDTDLTGGNGGNCVQRAN